MLNLIRSGNAPAGTAFADLGLIASVAALDVGTRCTYRNKLESARLVMFYDDRVTNPQNDLDEMDARVARLESLTGKPLRAKIHWVRGGMFGRRHFSLYGLAFGSSQSPTDWATADHPKGISVDRHELAHAVLHQQQPVDSDPPLLLIEGWAESQSGTSPQRRAQWAKESRELWRQRTNAGPHESYLRKLTSPAWYRRVDGAVYNVGGALADFILQKYGTQRFLRLYFATRPRQFEAACQEHLGVDLETLEAKFWEEVEQLAGDPEDAPR